MPKPNLKYFCASDFPRYRADMLHLLDRCADGLPVSAYDTYYQGNPLGPPLLGLCFDGEKLVGQENYVRQDLAVASTRYSGALGLNTLVDPSYRVFHGVFARLVEMTIEELRPRVDVLFAYANEASKKYYLKYFNWKVASPIRAYKKALRLSGWKKESLLALLRPGKTHSDVRLQETSQFEARVLDPVLAQHLVNSQEAYFHKTTDFLNWKFLYNKRYRTAGYYIFFHGSVKGYCITYDDGNICKVLDVLVDDNGEYVFSKTVSTLAYLTKKRGLSQLMIYATPDCWYRKLLHKHFFFPRWEFEFIFLDFSEQISNANWVVHIGDFDVF